MKSNFLSDYHLRLNNIFSVSETRRILSGEDGLDNAKYDIEHLNKLKDRIKTMLGKKKPGSDGMKGSTGNNGSRGERGDKGIARTQGDRGNI